MQEDSSERRVWGRTGVVHRAHQRHGPAVEVESEPGKKRECYSTAIHCYSTQGCAFYGEQPRVLESARKTASPRPNLCKVEKKTAGGESETHQGSTQEVPKSSAPLDRQSGRLQRNEKSRPWWLVAARAALYTSPSGIPCQKSGAHFAVRAVCRCKSIECQHESSKKQKCPNSATYNRTSEHAHRQTGPPVRLEPSHACAISTIGQPT